MNEKAKKIREEYKVVSETERDITISCCEGRMIRVLSKENKKSPVAIPVFSKAKEETNEREER